MEKKCAKRIGCREEGLYLLLKGGKSGGRRVACENRRGDCSSKSEEREPLKRGLGVKACNDPAKVNKGSEWVHTSFGGRKSLKKSDALL